MFTRRRFRDFDYLFISPREWKREHETHSALRRYQVLDLWSATRVLEEVARTDLQLLRELAEDVLPYFYSVNPPSHSYEEAREDERRGEQLKKALGSPFSERGKPPTFAQLYVCKRTPRLHASPDLPDPNRKVREALDAAERAPRGYVVVEAVNGAGSPVSGLRLELLFSDGEVRTVQTNAQGQARAEPIPQGQCHIRVPHLDGSSWRPEKGPGSTPVDQGGQRRMHIVQRGECLASIARQYGITDWELVWNAPENEPLRKKRKNPNVLWPDDEVAVPRYEVHEVVRPTDQTHRIVVTEAEAKVRLCLQDLSREPFADLTYDYAYDRGGTRIEKPGSAPTDADGWLEETVPLGVEALEVTLHKPRLRLVLQVNALDPAQDHDTETPILSGVQMRLASLGYAPGPRSEELSPRVRQAVASFQTDALSAEEPTGDLDAETLHALERAYGV